MCKRWDFQWDWYKLWKKILVAWDSLLFSITTYLWRTSLLPTLFLFSALSITFVVKSLRVVCCGKWYNKVDMKRPEQKSGPLRKKIKLAANEWSTKVIAQCCKLLIQNDILKDCIPLCVCYIGRRICSRYGAWPFTIPCNIDLSSGMLLLWLCCKYE